MTADEVRKLVVDKAPVSFQFAIIGICFLITVIDGFDILSISFIAPIIAREWGLSDVELGVIFSSGLAGMTLGALFLSPIGDILGRRVAILLLLALIGTGMVLTALAKDFIAIILFRLITGLGIGGIASNVGTTILEFVAPKRKAAALGLVFVGTPIGAIISGSITLFFINLWGWQSVLLCGGALTLAMVIAVYFGLPESIEFLMARRPAKALARLNAVLRRLRIEPLEVLPQPGNSEQDSKKRILDVFHGELLATTIPIGLIHLFYMFGFYAFVNWSAKLVIDMGLSDGVGISIAMLINVGGIVGALTVGLIAARLGLLKTTSIGFLAVGIGLTSFGFAPELAWLLSCIIVVTGYFFFGIQVSLYTFVASCYPASVRTTAIGLAFTIGRLGSILGPYTAGVMLESGLGRPAVLLALAIPQVLAAILVSVIARRNTHLTPA
ncbi:MAG: MFS transporter [Gammaproteobacteria bacterium]|nr:MFS transporter [Gammaproteobacteria bacterium]